MPAHHAACSTSSPKIPHSSSRPSPTQSSIASSTTPTASRSTARRCERSRPPTSKQHCRPWTPRAAQARRQRSWQKEPRNDHRHPARPGGSTGTSRARRCVSREGTPRRARAPPIDYRDGLAPCLTCPQETDITIITQRCRHAPASHWSRCAGMTGRNRRNAQVSTEPSKLATLRNTISKQSPVLDQAALRS